MSDLIPNVWTFLALTLIIGGAGAFVTGRTMAQTWRERWKAIAYMVPLAGAVRFGPNIEWIDAFDYALPDRLPETFAAAIKTYWPNVADHMLSPSYCGIRPKIHGPDAGFADFKIQDASEHGMPGLVNLFGIESPGLTSSLAIADHVVAGIR